MRKLKSRSDLSQLPHNSTDIFAYDYTIDKKLSDYMSITSSSEQMTGISFYEFVVWFTENKSKKITSLCSSDLLRIGNERYFQRRNKNSVFNTSPKMPPDFNDVMGAWGILLAHHKHFNRLENDTWVFEDSVSILRREIDLGNMEDSMNRVVSKLKFQEEILKDTKKPSREEKGEYELQEHEDFVENQGKPELENEFEMEDLNQSFIDPLLLNQPIFPGAKIADRLLFSQAEKFIATIKLDQKAARSLKMLEFVKDGSDFDSINERLKPSTHV